MGGWYWVTYNNILSKSDQQKTESADERHPMHRYKQKYKHLPSNHLFNVYEILKEYQTKDKDLYWSYFRTDHDPPQKAPIHKLFEDIDQFMLAMQYAPFLINAEAPSTQHLKAIVWIRSNDSVICDEEIPEVHDKFMKRSYPQYICYI